jgi:transketolase
MVEIVATIDIGLVAKLIDSIPFLAIDVDKKAIYEHPRFPMGCASMSYILYDEVVRCYLKNPNWFIWDHFVLSVVHGCFL